MRRHAIAAGTALALVGALVVMACSSFASETEPSVDAATEAADEATSTEAAACDPGTFASDPHNCGACGHDCLGGACADGRCQPSVVGRTTFGPTFEIALDRDNVYWNAQVGIDSAGDLEWCRKTGCTASPNVLSLGGQTVASVGSDGDAAVWAGLLFGGSGLFALENGTLVPKVPNINPRYVELRPQGVLFANFYDPNNGRTIRLYADGGTTTLCAYPDGIGTAYPLAWGANRVYLHANGAGKIYTCALDQPGAVMTEFFQGIYTNTMAVAGGKVFWHSDGALWSCPDGVTCAAATGELGPTDIGADVTKVAAVAGGLYLFTKDSRILTCDPAACRASQRPVLSDPDLDQTHPYGRPFAIDERAYYYSAVDARGGDGGTPSAWRVVRLAK